MGKKKQKPRKLKMSLQKQIKMLAGLLMVVQLGAGVKLPETDEAMLESLMIGEED